MSTPTLIRAAGDSGDWDDFLQFAAITRNFNTAEFDQEPREPHRPARTNDRRAAIEQSLYGEA